MQRGSRILSGLVAPRARHEDDRRREFILNILLLGFMGLTGSATLIVVVNALRLGSDHLGSSPLFMVVVFGLYVGFYRLSRKGFARPAAYAFVATLYIATVQPLLQWGVDLPMVLLTFAVLVVLSGILVSSRFAALMTVNIAATILLLGHLQSRGILLPKTYWREEMLVFGDLVGYSIALGMVAVVSWLSNREQEKSKAALKLERDSLEIKVKDRTRDLKQTQEEKARQMYRFVDFGRMASGYMHDLGPPLGTISANLHRLEKRRDIPEDAQAQVKLALQGLANVDELNRGAQRQIQKQDITVNFSPAEHISLALKMLSYKAGRARVKLDWTSPPNSIELVGNPLKFYRLLTGLVDNAIDAYSQLASERDNRRVAIDLSATDHAVQFTVRDLGSGIAAAHLGSIFKSLWTTKDAEHGTGIGLPLCKETVEADFGGTLRVESREEYGSTFTVTLPKHHHGDRPTPSSPTHVSNPPQARH